MDARQALDPECFDTKISHRPDQYFFNVAYVAVNILAFRRKRDDRIADDLTEAMICDFAAAVCLKNLDAELSEHFGCRENPVCLRSSTYSKSVRMLEK
jgi:hypothetical protein